MASRILSLTVLSLVVKTLPRGAVIRHLQSGSEFPPEKCCAVMVPAASLLGKRREQVDAFE